MVRVLWSGLYVRGNARIVSGSEVGVGWGICVRGCWLKVGEYAVAHLVAFFCITLGGMVGGVIAKFAEDEVHVLIAVGWWGW